MDVPKELAFTGAGSYWNNTGPRRRRPPSEKPTTPDTSKPSVAQGDPLQTPIDLCDSELPSELGRTSLVCETRNTMGLAKENSMAL